MPTAAQRARGCRGETAVDVHQCWPSGHISKDFLMLLSDFFLLQSALPLAAWCRLLRLLLWRVLAAWDTLWDVSELEALAPRDPDNFKESFSMFK